MNNMISHLISVIVPVYNTEKYLDECIQSILNQSFTDFELLLIDDGSTDRSGAICDQYAAKDERVRVFHTENGGVSSARNVGLDEAKGEWIAFVDSDDWVKSLFLENFIRYVDDVDIIISYSEIETKNGIHKIEISSEGIVTNTNFHELFTKYGMTVNTTSWAKLYRKDLIEINKIRFDNRIKMGEDTVFLYTCLLKAEKIFVLNKTDYYYRDRSESLSKQIYWVEDELVGYNQLSFVIDELIKQKPIRDNEALNKLHSIVAYYVVRVLESLYKIKIPFSRRISIIKSLNFSALDYICYNRIQKFLLRNKQYILYDLSKKICLPIYRYENKLF